ncbi:MAG TPA: hypothetical protein VF458_07315 [Ktedonobacteraceae bacterium]
MKREDQLDALIEGQYYQGGWRLVSDDEFADSLAAAEQLAHLREIDVPVDFARRLEASLRARVRSLPRPISPFPQTRSTVSRMQRQGASRARLIPGRRALVAMLGVVAMLVAACTGLLTASANSLPDGPLYGLKQVENQVRLTFASDPQTRAYAQMNVLRDALGDLKTEVNNGHSDAAITQALRIVASRTQDSQQAVRALPAGSERDAGQQDLDHILASEDQLLRHLLAHADWPLRVLFTKQLGALGSQVPSVTRVSISLQPDGTLLVTLTGAFFASQAEFMVDGQPGGTVLRSNSSQMVVVLTRAALSQTTHLHTFGVLNPDGTAAQIIHREGDDRGGQDS